MRKTNKYSAFFKKALILPQIPWILILIIWAAWMLTPFFNVGMTTQDQIGFSLNDTSNLTDTIFHHVSRQGRIYFYFTKTIDIIYASFPDSWIIKQSTFFVFIISPLCFAYAVFTSNKIRLIFIWIFTCLTWLGTSHMPPAAYPVVNHLPFIFWIPFAWIIRDIKKKENKPSKKSITILAGISFLCFFQYEPVALISVLILPWIIFSAKLSKSSSKKLYTAVGSSAALYLFIYIFWSITHPTNYSGLQTGTIEFGSIFRTFFVFTIGSLPWLGSYDNTMDFRWQNEGYGEHFFRNHQNWAPSFESLEILIAFFGIISAIATIHNFNTSKSKLNSTSINPRIIPAWVYILFFSLMLGVINGPISISKKYQIWASNWDNSYLTSQLALYPICGALALLTFFIDRPTKMNKTPIGLISILGVIGIAGFFVHDHNSKFSVLLRGNLARWDALSMISNTSHMWEEKRVNVPQLYFEVFSRHNDWSKYWDAYTKKRYGNHLHFSAFLSSEDQPDTEYVNAKLYLKDNGALRCVTIQSLTALYLISTPSNRPSQLVDDQYNELSLNWKREGKSIGTSLHVLKIENNKNFVGLNKKITPTWSLPPF